jgi:predicted transcriptional regulator
MTTTIFPITPVATDKLMDEAKRDRILAGIARRPSAANYDISKNLSAVTSAEVAEVRASMAGEVMKGPQDGRESELEAIQLNQKRVMPQKPQGSDCRRRLHEIKRGVCYRVADFAQHIGVSEDTIRRHAKALHCIKWVEMSPDNFEECVMSPETAKQYLR